MIENPKVLQKAAQRGEILRELNANHTRGVGLDLGAFDGVIINENKTVQAEIQLLREGAKILRLGRPIESTGCKVGSFERHLVKPKDFFDIFGVIFAAEAKEHACSQLGTHEFLERATRLVDLDARRTIFAANSAPERLVAIQDDDFSRRPLERMEFAGNDGAQRREEQWSIWNVSEIVGVRIVVFIDGVQAHEVGISDNVSAGN